MGKRTLGVWFAALAAIANMAWADQPASDAEHESEFRFRFVGPKIGNRIAAVAGVPGDPSVYYAGAASGGVWKSVDGGNRWAPVSDKQPVAAIHIWSLRGELWATTSVNSMAKWYLQ